jgi:intergrase/recombinase
LLEEYKKNIDLINSRWSHLKLIKRLFNYLKEQNVSEDVLIPYKKLLKKSKKDKIDNFVPTDLEIKDSLDKLSLKHKQLYLLFLTSGLRKVEGIYLLNNFNNLRYQEYSDYVKINMSYKRKNKNSYFCYLPRGIYIKLKVFFDKITIVALEQEIKRKKLIPIKYCRKWFFTKCVELGIPETIADFYEGRVANSVGSNHYLSRQMLGDKYYSKANNFFVKFFDLKKGCIYDIV